MQRIVSILFAVMLTAQPLAAQRPAVVRGFLADSSLAFLAPLIGEWMPLLPDSMIQRIGFQPIAGNYRWVVGRQAIQFRENYRAGGDPDSALLHGMIYWNPATETVEFTAVAGPLAGEGRLFRGAYRQRENGTIEREYDVFYRTLADIPGEEYGGSRRRYLETVTFVTPDSIDTTLKWWFDGAWRPFGRFSTGKQARWRPRAGPPQVQ